MTSRVLITGGAGYIGSHTVLAATEAGYEVVVIDDLSTGHRASVPPEVGFIESNIGDRDAMAKVLRDVKADTVMHFAGSIIVPESVVNPSKYYLNNTAAAFNLIAACLAEDCVEAFIFSSTAAVYGMPAGGVAIEETPPQPINPYGRSKRMVEQVLEDVYAAHGLKYAVLRYFNVAGADDKQRTGQYAPNATHLIKKACQAALGSEAVLKIFGTDYDTPDGSCIRDFIHVSDLAAAHIDVMALLQESNSSYTLNCGNGVGYSVRDVVSALEGVTGKPLPVEVAPRRAGDPPKLIADGRKLRALTGWQPHYVDLRSIVASALRWEEKLAHDLTE